MKVDGPGEIVTWLSHVILSWEACLECCSKMSFAVNKCWNAGMRFMKFFKQKIHIHP